MTDSLLQEDPRLDRIYAQDLRSLNFLHRATPQSKPRSYTWGLATVLDQGAEGSCVGHGYAHELAAKPVSVPGITHEYAVNIYYSAQHRDPWPGGAYPGAEEHYEGTSMLAGAQTMKELGFYSEYRWGLDAYDVADYVGHRGPAVLGLNWYTGMYAPDVTGFLHPTGRLVGGHCLLAVGVKIVWRSWVNRLVSSTWENIDTARSYIKLHNSWGPGWGDHGRANLTLDDLATLMVQQGEACFPVRSAA